MKNYEVTQLVEVTYALVLDDEEDVYDAINYLGFYVDVQGNGVDADYMVDAESNQILSVSE